MKRSELYNSNPLYSPIMERVDEKLPGSSYRLDTIGIKNSQFQERPQKQIAYVIPLWLETLRWATKMALVLAKFHAELERMEYQRTKVDDSPTPLSEDEKDELENSPWWSDSNSESSDSKKPKIKSEETDHNNNKSDREHNREHEREGREWENEHPQGPF
jgi:hypothetical protein